MITHSKTRYLNGCYKEQNIDTETAFAKTIFYTNLGYLSWKIHWNVEETHSKNFIRDIEVHHDPFVEFEEARSGIWNMPRKILSWVDWLAQFGTEEQRETKLH